MHSVCKTTADGQVDLQSTTSSLISALSGAAGSPRALTTKGARLAGWADRGFWIEALVKARATGVPLIAVAKLMIAAEIYQRCAL